MPLDTRASHGPSSIRPTGRSNSLPHGLGRGWLGTLKPPQRSLLSSHTPPTVGLAPFRGDLQPRTRLWTGSNYNWTRAMSMPGNGTPSTAMPAHAVKRKEQQSITSKHCGCTPKRLSEPTCLQAKGLRSTYSASCSLSQPCGSCQQGEDQVTGPPRGNSRANHDDQRARGGGDCWLPAASREQVLV